MVATPNVENLALPRGKIKWMENGESEYRDLGECLTFTTNMEVETLPYVSKRSGTRVTVKEVPIEKRLNLGFTLNELAFDNMMMRLMGTESGSPPVIAIGAKSELRGAIRYVGTNDIGPRWQIDLYDVILIPDGDTDMLPDEWGELPMSGRVMFDNTVGSFGDAQEITAEVPMNGSPPV